MTARLADEDVISDMINAELETRSDRIVGMLGPAPGTEHVTGKAELELWDEAADGVDVIAAYWKARQEGIDEEGAMDAASLEKYPNRGTMLLSAAPDDEGRKVYAKRMRRESEKLAAQAVDEPVAESYSRVNQAQQIPAPVTQQPFNGGQDASGY